MNWLPGATPAGFAAPRVPLTITGGGEGFQTSNNQSSYTHSTAPMGADVPDRFGCYAASFGEQDVDLIELGDPYNTMIEAGSISDDGITPVNSLGVWYLPTDGLGEGTEPRVRSSTPGGNALRFYGYPFYINGSKHIVVHDVVTTGAGGILSVQTVPGCAVFAVEANNGSSGRSLSWTGGTTMSDSEKNGSNGNWRCVGQSNVDGGVISTNSMASDSTAIMIAFRGF